MSKGTKKTVSSTSTPTEDSVEDLQIKVDRLKMVTGKNDWMH